MKIKSIILTALLLNFSHFVNASEVPEGWQLAGSNPQGYDFVIEKNQGQPAPSGKLISNDQVKSKEFGTSMQAFFPEDYLGKRVKLSAKIKSRNVIGWSGLWMRIDTDKKHAAAFDNMQSRPIVGDTDWQDYSVILDVPKDSNKLSYGVLVVGSGEVWFDEFSFSIVDLSIAVTDMNSKTTNNGPTNTSF
jgi:hypothetical protein